MALRARKPWGREKWLRAAPERALWAAFSWMGSVRGVAVRDRAVAGRYGAPKTALYAALMTHRADFWKFEQLSDAQLLENLSGTLRTQRRSLAELVALLGEVEDRRLHLEAAYGSMFSYCVSRLGMSEDEACRRIELARLARKFPALFAEIETGRLTLSVALVLKPVLSPDNHLELLAAARGKCVRQARELVASRFPKPDAPSSIRKLPERQGAASDLAADAAPAASAAGRAPPSSSSATLARPSASPEPPAGVSPELLPRSLPSAVSLAIPSAGAVCHPLATPPSASAEFTLSLSHSAEPSPSPEPRDSYAPVARSSIEPLSAQRYRIQFTADAALKQQLESARELLRHAHPSGDLGPIVSRALKLLLDELLRRRFGVGARRNVRGAASAKAKRSSAPEPETGERPAAAKTKPSSAPKPEASERPASALSPPAPFAEASPSADSTTARAPHIRIAARRAVFERDGLGCGWVDAHGMRCGSHAWLELDHRQPAGKGGNCAPENLRLLCRAHNQFAAERAYGREHIERASRRRKTKARSARTE